MSKPDTSIREGYPPLDLELPPKKNVKRPKRRHDKAAESEPSTGEVLGGCAVLLYLLVSIITAVHAWGNPRLRCNSVATVGELLAKILVNVFIGLFWPLYWLGELCRIPLP